MTMKKTVSCILLTALLLSLLPGALADSAELHIYLNDNIISFKTLDVDTIVTRALRFEARSADGTIRENVNWKSSNEGMAKVDENGNVAINVEKEGEVIISCQTTDGSGRISSTKLKLYKRVHNLSLEHYSTYNMRAQSIVSFKPRFISPMGLEYSPTDPKLNWDVVAGNEYAYFSNPASGTLCAESVSKPENVLVRLRSGDNSKAIAYMNVIINPAVEKISIFRAGADVTGQSFSNSASAPVKLNAKISPDQEADIMWSSSSSNAKVMDGLVIASAPCSVIITASATDGSGISASVTINFQ